MIAEIALPKNKGLTMSKNKILMCPPNYFSVDYVINP